MKKTFLLLTVLVLWCSSLRANVTSDETRTIMAENFKYEDYVYNLYSDGTAEVCGINPSLITGSTTSQKVTKDLLMPPNVTYKGYNYQVKSVKIYNLSSINIASITISGLVSRVEIRGSNVSIGTLTIPARVNYLKLGDMVSPTKVSSINVKDLKTWCQMDVSYNDGANYVFALGAKLLVNGVEVKGELDIPNGTKTIHPNCFNGLKGITSVIIPNTVTTIGSNAFEGTGITSVKIPNSVTSLDGSFIGCTALTSVEIPNSVTSLNATFWKCSALTSIDIPNSVTTIGARTFYGTGLTTVNLPSSITNMGGTVFPKSLTTVFITDLDAFSKIKVRKDGRDYRPFTNDYTLYLNGEKVTEITIPDDMEEISSVYVDILDIEYVYIPENVNYWSAGFNRSNVRRIHVISRVPISFLPIQFIIDNATESRDVRTRGRSGLWPFEATNKATCEFIVPYGCKEAYQNNEFTSQFNIVENAFTDANGYTYALDGKLAEIVEAPKEISGAVVVPSEALIDGNKYTVTSIGKNAFEGRYEMTSVTIPSTIKSIGDYAFADCTMSDRGLKKVVFSGSSVWRIGNYSFASCLLLESISIPASVTTIGEGAFFNCKKLSSDINIPTGVNAIEAQTFKDCEELEKVIIPSSVNIIKADAFNGCSKLKPITIPVGVTSIGDGAFFDCDAIEEIVIPEGVLTIGDGAFNDCDNLRSVTIPSTILLRKDNNGDPYAYETGFNAFTDDNLEKIYSYIKAPEAKHNDSFTFRANKPLTLYVPKGSVGLYRKHWANDADFPTIEEMVDGSGGIAFASNAVKDICLANWDTNPRDGSLSAEEAAAVTKIGDEFKGNKDITSFNELQYFTGLTEIASNAFYNCEKLTSIKLPASVKKVGDAAFVGCSALANFDFAPNMDMKDFEMGIGCFTGCSNLKNFTVDGNTNGIIRKWSSTQDFSVVDGVLYVRIDNDPYTLYSYPGNHGKTFTIPESVVQIDAYAFCMTSIKEVTLPAKLRFLGDYAFAYCSNLTNLTANATIPCEAEKAFIGSTATATLHIPSVGLKGLYQTEPGWKDFSSIMTGSGAATVFADDTKEMYYRVLNDQSVALIAINSSTGGKVTIPATVSNGGKTYTVTYIGSGEENWSANWVDRVMHYDFSVFDMRYGLSDPTVTEVVIPNTVKSIGSCALQKNSRCELEKVEIPGSVEDIGACAFYNNPLKKLTLNKGLKIIRELAFSILSGEKVEDGIGDLVIPEGVTTIESAAFGWRNLKSVTIPASVSYIGLNNFRKYYNVKDMEDVQELTINISDLDAWCKIECERGSWFAKNYRLYRDGKEVRVVKFPDGMDHIEPVFSYCMSLEKITIPSSVSWVEHGAFYYCKNLKTIVNLSRYPQQLLEKYINTSSRSMTRADSETDDAKPFENVDKDVCTLYVPAGCASTYRAADEWNTFKNIKEIEHGDASGDGFVNWADVNLVKEYIMTGIEPDGFIWENANTNDDNKIDAADIVNIVNIINSRSNGIEGEAVSLGDDVFCNSIDGN